MITHDIGNFFWGIDNIKGKMTEPTTAVYEIEHYLFRQCPDARVYRIFPGKALIYGRWIPGKPVNEHLMEALKGRELVQTSESPALLGP